MGDSDSLGHLPLSSLLERLASADPVPGGGSAAAIAGAMGAALVGMVAELSIGRPDYAEHESALLGMRAAAHDRRLALLALADEDAAAYEGVVRARRLPRSSETERETRAAAIRVAMIGAAEVPMRTARVAAEVLALAGEIAPIGNRVAVSDAGVAAQLARAAVRGAVLNVRINLPYLPTDEPLRNAAPADLERLERESDERERSAVAAVDARIQSP